MVVPVYNERQTILELLERIVAVDVSKEVIVVDDGSTDGTAEALRGYSHPAVRVITQANRGRGYALRQGWASARGRIIMNQDADLEYNPGEYPALIQPILDDEADVVFGSRFKGTMGGMMFRAWLANRALTLMINLIYRARLTDSMTCYKVFRSDTLRTLKWTEDSWELDAQIIAQILRRRIRLREVPITFEARSYEEGKKLRAKHFFTMGWSLLRYRFRNQ